MSPNLMKFVQRMRFTFYLTLVIGIVSFASYKFMKHMSDKEDKSIAYPYYAEKTNFWPPDWVPHPLPPDGPQPPSEPPIS